MKTAAGDKILRDVFLGFIRIHVPLHAAEDPIVGLDAWLGAPLGRAALPLAIASELVHRSHCE